MGQGHFCEMSGIRCTFKSIIFSHSTGPLPITFCELKECGQAKSGHAGDRFEKWFNKHSSVNLSLKRHSGRSKT